MKRPRFKMSSSLLAGLVVLLMAPVVASADPFGAGSGADGELVVDSGDSVDDLNRFGTLSADIEADDDSLQMEDATALSEGWLVMMWRWRRGLLGT